MGMATLDDYPNLIDNTDQARSSRCNHFVQVLWTGEYVDYVRCNACDEKQALWREENRL